MTLVTVIINDAPYDSERAYNGLRTALTLGKKAEVKVHVFLMAGATFCSLKNQTTPNGYYNIGRMINSISRKGKIGACGSCMDARGLKDIELLEGIHRSTMDELSDWILDSDKIISY